jgi:hypothetical protein
VFPVSVMRLLSNGMFSEQAFSKSVFCPIGLCLPLSFLVFHNTAFVSWAFSIPQ